jgi:hypothetical protein
VNVIAETGNRLQRRANRQLGIERQNDDRWLQAFLVRGLFFATVEFQHTSAGAHCSPARGVRKKGNASEMSNWSLNRAISG